MKLYKPKALIEGYKLGDKFAGKMYVAVPSKKVNEGYAVAFGNEVMVIQGMEPATRLKFQDNYGRGAYWLYYFEWLPGPLTICGYPQYPQHSQKEKK
jgi:hypothetical protein